MPNNQYILPSGALCDEPVPCGASIADQARLTGGPCAVGKPAIVYCEDIGPQAAGERFVVQNARLECSSGGVSVEEEDGRVFGQGWVYVGVD